jgi:hydroxymethylpyrimidine/phosphomethylpyrimidine kinase
MVAKATVIAGSDSCSGAGLQADLKTFSSLGVFATTVVTLVTAQNTAGVIKASPVEPEIVRSQIDAIMTDISCDAVKIGVLPSIDCVQAVGKSLVKYNARNIVLDPVLVATTGHVFGDQNVTDAILTKLFPLVDLATPNIREIEQFSGLEIRSFADLKSALSKLGQAGVKNVLATGWVDGDSSVDVLFDGSDFHEFRAPIVKKANVHGAGCTFSSAIAANLALGFDMITAISNSKTYVTKAIQNSFFVGSGLKVLAHFQPKDIEK